MANDNQSRGNPSRQQSAERSPAGSAQQGTGAQRGTSQAGGYGQGSYTQGSSGQGSNAPATGASTGHGARQPSGGAMQTWRGASSMTPYSGASSGYGGGPFSMMRRITDEMDRLFENLGMGRSFFPGESTQGGSWDVGAYGGEGAPSMWSPHIEVCERNGKLLIQADLPGIKRDDVHVHVDQDEVIIQGDRRQEQSHAQGGYYRSERCYGSFYRTIPLPEGANADSATASFRDGVLEIELDAPRRQERGRTLEIHDGGTSQGGSRAGTGAGATYGSGTTGSMQDASSGSAGSHAGSAGQHGASGAGGSQQSASGAGGSSKGSAT